MFLLVVIRSRDVRSQSAQPPSDAPYVDSVITHLEASGALDSEWKSVRSMKRQATQTGLFLNDGNGAIIPIYWLSRSTTVIQRAR